MRYLTLSILLITFLFGEASGQSGLELKNKTVENELLAEILNFSEMKELKKPAPTASPYFLRLYSISGFGEKKCAPANETEVTCSTRYYLALNDGSLGFLGKIYDLGEVGEITKIQWLENSNPDVARLRVEICNYPKHVFRLNPKLIKKTKIVELFLSTNSLEIRKVN